MEDRNMRYQTDNVENKKTAKAFWKQFGLFALALALAAFTVLVINL